MHKLHLQALPATLAALIALVLAGCGSGATGNETIATVGKTPITRGSLQHWAAVFVRGDFYQVMGRRAPIGLSSSPPNFASCASAGATMAPPTKAGRAAPTRAELLKKCRALYHATELEALSFLITGLWSAGQDAALGIHVSDREVKDAVNSMKTMRYASDAAFRAYLRDKGWSLADLEFVLRRDLLGSRYTEHLRQGESAIARDRKRYVALVESGIVRWTAKTNCKSGYVVSECKQFNVVSKHSPGPSPAAIFEQIAAGK